MTSSLTLAIVFGVPSSPLSLVHGLNRRVIPLQIDLEKTDVTSVMAVPVSGPGYGHSRFYIVRARISPSKTIPHEKLPLIDAAHLPPALSSHPEPPSLYLEILKLPNPHFLKTLTTYNPCLGSMRERLLVNTAVIGTLESGEEVLDTMASGRGVPTIVACGEQC
jgi:hypothetical protein